MKSLAGILAVVVGFGIAAAPAAAKTQVAVAKIKGLLGTVQHETSATYKATYEVSRKCNDATETGGYPPCKGGWLSRKFVYEQAPRRLRIVDGSVSTVGIGKTFYDCSTVCSELATLSFAVVPLPMMPDFIRGALTDLKTEVDLNRRSYNATFSNARYAGRTATCITMMDLMQATMFYKPTKECVTDNGILAYYWNGAPEGTIVTLKSLSSDVPARDFKLPAPITVKSLRGERNALRPS